MCDHYSVSFWIYISWVQGTLFFQRNGYLHQVNESWLSCPAKSVASMGCTCLNFCILIQHSLIIIIIFVIIKSVNQFVCMIKTNKKTKQKTPFIKKLVQYWTSMLRRIKECYLIILFLNLACFWGFQWQIT